MLAERKIIIDEDLIAFNETDEEEEYETVRFISFLPIFLLIFLLLVLVIFIIKYFIFLLTIVYNRG